MQATFYWQAREHYQQTFGNSNESAKLVTEGRERIPLKQTITHRRAYPRVLLRDGLLMAYHYIYTPYY